MEDQYHNLAAFKPASYGDKSGLGAATTFDCKVSSVLDLVYEPEIPNRERIPL